MGSLCLRTPAAHLFGGIFDCRCALVRSGARLPHILIRSVLEPHVNLFKDGTTRRSAKLAQRAFAPALASRRRRSECRGRDEKCAGNAPFSSRSGRIASGITWRRRRGAVLGSPHARAPKVSPKMVGSLSRGNERGPRRKYFRWGKLGGNPQEGGNNTSLSRDVTPIKLAWARRTLIRRVRGRSE